MQFTPIDDELLKTLEDYIMMQQHRFGEVPRDTIRDDVVIIEDSIKYQLGAGQTFKFYPGQVGEGAVLEVNDMFGDGQVWRVYTIVEGDRAWSLTDT